MRALYVAASGMTAQQTRIDTVADNLANANTTSFKRSRGAFQDVFYQELSQGGKAPTAPRADAGAGVRLAGLLKDHSQGSLQHTGDAMNIALKGEGFFVVEDDHGNRAYTRDGALQTDSEGVLRVASGYRVAGDIVVPEDAVGIDISKDGTISARIPDNDGETSYTIGQIEIAQFVNASGLEPLGGNLYAASMSSGDPMYTGQESVEVEQYHLEGSNVEASEELIELILAQRAYELNSKVIQAADETMQVATNLRR